MERISETRTLTAVERDKVNDVCLNLYHALFAFSIVVDALDESSTDCICDLYPFNESLNEVLDKMMFEVEDFRDHVDDFRIANWKSIE